ncbi:GNAT family N-acetyltransferase [Fontibacter flavus]|uniref:GNAT family N-acetyltransferase n=1 Tax=Fontibacter flavus TaxID=654838 RepID=A0ABV6FXP4_9BACT
MGEPFLIQTERTLIRKLTFDDAEFVYQLQQSPGWKKYIGDRGVHSVHDAIHYLKEGPMRSYVLHGYGLFLVQLKSGQKIGISGLIKRDYLGYPDIGFALLPEYEGKGFAFESASAVLHYAMKYIGIDRIQAIVMEENKKSIQLLEKLGMKDLGLQLFPGQERPLKLFEIQIEKK